MRVLDVKGVASKIGLSRSQIYRILKSDPSFPKPIRLSPRRIGWRENEVDSWIDDRPRVGEDPEEIRKVG